MNKAAELSRHIDFTLFSLSNYCILTFKTIGVIQNKIAESAKLGIIYTWFYS